MHSGENIQAGRWLTSFDLPDLTFPIVYSVPVEQSAIVHGLELCRLLELLKY